MERYESRSGTLTVNVQKHAWAKKLNYFFLIWTFSNIFLIFYTIYNLRYFLSIIKYGHKALINFQKKIEIGFCWNIFPCILDPLIILTDPHNWILPQVLISFRYPYLNIIIISFVGLWECAADAALAQAADQFPLQDPRWRQRPHGPIIQYGGLHGVTWPSSIQVQRDHRPLPSTEQKL